MSKRRLLEKQNGGLITSFKKLIFLKTYSPKNDEITNVATVDPMRDRYVLMTARW
jgi:hypothetical protein